MDISNKIAVGGGAGTGTVNRATLKLTSSQSCRGRAIEDAAGQFEAILLEELCSKLRQSFAPGDDQAEGGGNDGFSELGTKYLALGISQRGGCGIAKFLVPHLRSADNADAGRLERFQQ